MFLLRIVGCDDLLNDMMDTFGRAGRKRKGGIGYVPMLNHQFGNGVYTTYKVVPHS